MTKKKPAIFKIYKKKCTNDTEVKPVKVQAIRKEAEYDKICKNIAIAGTVFCVVWIHSWIASFFI